MKHCIIIGSGLGGLSCGCIMARNGYDVTVLEQADQIGGCLQCFKRGDAVFDTGMHYIGSALPGQTLHTMLQYLGVDKDVSLSRLQPDGYDIIAFRGEHYAFANGHEAFVDQLAQHFPESRRQLEEYYRLIKEVAASSALHSLNRRADMNMNAEYQMRSVDEVIRSIITDPVLSEVVAGILPLYAGEKSRTPFSTHALIADFYEQSAFRIVGGSGKVASSLADSIRRMGGRVLTNRKVEKILCNDQRATAVVTADGERLDGDLIISAIHPSRTLQLIDSHLLRPAYRTRIRQARNTTSAFTVYLKFRKNAVKYMNRNLYLYRGNTVWGCEHYDELSWPKYLLYMHFCHEQNPSFAQTGQILTYMNFEEVKPWVGTHVGQRGASYEDFKHRKAEQLIDALEAEVPGLRNSIETYYTSTPLTYVDYTGIPDGAMYGIAKDINTLGSGSISCKTRIPNLLLAGQSTVLHGMLGVIAGSFVTCSEILTTDEIFDQLLTLKSVITK